MSKEHRLCNKWGVYPDDVTRVNINRYANDPKNVTRLNARDPYSHRSADTQNDATTPISEIGIATGMSTVASAICETLRSDDLPN